MTEAGRLRFLGHYTSSIQFDVDTQLWRWLDMKDKNSVATRTVPILDCLLGFSCNSVCLFSSSLVDSMLLGAHVFDFSQVLEDPCTSSLASKLVRVKVTACGSGQFTCDDGQCVSIDERCNQISNCR